MPVPCGMANALPAILAAILAIIVCVCACFFFFFPPPPPSVFLRFRPGRGRAAILELPLVSGNSGGNSREN